MNSYESFVYCWTDTKRNMLYVGKHKGDINDGYICSSKYFLSEYKNKTYDSKSDLCSDIGATKYELSKMITSGKVKEVV